MPRISVKKTSRAQSDLSRYKDAYEEVKAGNSLRKAADNQRINHCPLLRYLRNRRASSHFIKRTDPEKSGFNVPVVNRGLTKTASKVVLAVFAKTATQIDP
ncbi:hypothetical protein EVAR_41646_1 [Eumeta japonica]|uniref:Uncharacterized protein n=1 Tax=Eumeta variegata TaxID=151549 RepID=A0A4C1X3M8_EUMVA|nr:hypothetical protein EVAR_41646_1 [Eumeta japonica]